MCFGMLMRFIGKLLVCDNRTVRTIRSETKLESGYTRMSENNRVSQTRPQPESMV